LATHGKGRQTNTDGKFRFLPNDGSQGIGEVEGAGSKTPLPVDETTDSWGVGGRAQEMLPKKFER
jgi:hypothetical protein